jgi:hypothetical protein
VRDGATDTAMAAATLARQGHTPTPTTTCFAPAKYIKDESRVRQNRVCVVVINDHCRGRRC